MQLQPAPRHHFHSTFGAVRLVKKNTNTKQNKSIIFKVLITTSWFLQGHILRECTSRVTLPTATTEWYFFLYTGSFVYYGNISYEPLISYCMLRRICMTYSKFLHDVYFGEKYNNSQKSAHPLFEEPLEEPLKPQWKGPWIVCDGECQNWYHFNHVGLSVAHEPLKEVWFCLKCTSTLNYNTQSLWRLCSCCIIIFKLNSAHLFTPAMFLWIDMLLHYLPWYKNFSTWHLSLLWLHHNPNFLTLHWDC